MKEQQDRLAELRDDELWQRYVSNREANVRQTLIRRHLELARKVAASLFAQRSDNTVEFEDYLQYGRVGLLESIDRFDPRREASFPTFASHRIRGAILNGIERSSEHSAQRQHRRRVRSAERLASVREHAAGETRDAFKEMVDVTIALALGYVLEDSGLWRKLEDDSDNDPYQSYEFKRLRERLAMIVEAMPEREQLIVKYHYYEHMEFIAIGELLGVSKGRVSQLHNRALQLIRDAYRALERFDVSC